MSSILSIVTLIVLSLLRSNPDGGLVRSEKHEFLQTVCLNTLSLIPIQLSVDTVQQFSKFTINSILDISGWSVLITENLCRIIFYISFQSDPMAIKAFTMILSSS